MTAMSARFHPFHCPRRSLSILPVCLLFLAATVATPSAKSQTWKPLGPDGGDVRTLASDPTRPNFVYLGTTDGHIFGSEDGGRHWQLLGLAGAAHNAIVTAILVDPRDSDLLLASIWTRESRGEGGGIYRSTDRGRSWHPAGLVGHAVRAFVAAPSDPDTLVAGALDGVFRSRDAGENWEMITPANDPELRNFDSLAVDPQDPEIIYAGTFHLPWKTVDGGRDWAAIHEGMIDDSDVLSLAVNPSDPQQVFASACSGIYRSDDAGSHWKRIQGIPDSSKRTLVIRFDPGETNTLYAGTTDGLWKSTEGGARWRRVSPSSWVVNALAVLPAANAPKSDERTAPEQSYAHVLIGTEQQGVMVSDSTTDNFEPANEGFDHRRVVSLVVDRENPGRLGAVLANASDVVIESDDGGETWAPLSSGLAPASVRRLFSTPAGWYAAVASGGLMHLNMKSGHWVREGLVTEGAETTASAALSVAARAKPAAATMLSVVVNDLTFSDAAWFAATEEGLFKSNDAGKLWSRLSFSSLPLPADSVRVSADGSEIRIVSSHGMVFSNDAGRSWQWHDLPLESYGALRLEIADETTLLATSPSGLYISRDDGATWSRAQSGLPASAVNDLLVRSEFWVVSSENGGLYISRDQGANWSRIESPSTSPHDDYFPVIDAGFATDSIYAASANESLFRVELARSSVLTAGVGAGHRP
jgi:photosystem II stability/assembly factor-like uncharacterized protein